MLLNTKLHLKVLAHITWNFQGLCR